MALEGYKSNNHVVYSSKYHVVWTPKYRRPVLVDKIAFRLQHLLHETCLRYQAEVVAVEIMPDHVHLLVEVDPLFGIHRLVKKLKGVTSHNLRKEFPVLKSRLPTLWTNSYFVSTVGGAPLAVIKQYVENQKHV
jgi:putative transposase